MRETRALLFLGEPVRPLAPTGGDGEVIINDCQLVTNEILTAILIKGLGFK